MDNLKLFDMEPTTVTSPGPRPEEIKEIFDYWVNAMEKDAKRTKLTKDRSKKIKRALSWYPKEYIFEAVEGCKLSRFHMGMNDQRKVYNDIELIVRNRDRLELFVQRYRMRTHIENEEIREIERIMGEF